MSYEELRKLAEAASPGPWELRVNIWCNPNGPDELCGTGPVYEASSYSKHGFAEHPQADADAAYIAAASPDVILSLLDKLAIAKEALCQISSPIDCPACSMENPPPEVPCYCYDNFYEPVRIATEALEKLNV